MKCVLIWSAVLTHLFTFRLSVSEVEIMKPVIALHGPLAVNVDATMWHDYLGMFLFVCVCQPEGLTNHQSSLIVFVFMSVCLCVCVRARACVRACVRACTSELVKVGRWLATRNFTVEAEGSYWHLFCYRRHNPTPLYGLGHQSRSANHRIRRRNG